MAGWGDPLVQGFMQTPSCFGGGTVPWYQYAFRENVALDDYGNLVGPWAECLSWAVHYEHSVNWQGSPQYQSCAPAGTVVAALSAAVADRGDAEQILAAAGALEQAAHTCAVNGQPLPVINTVATPPGQAPCPSAWNQGPPIANRDFGGYVDPYAGLYGVVPQQIDFFGVGAARRQQYEQQHQLWEQKEHDHNFFGLVKLAKDGGLSEVKDMYSETRLVFSIMNIGFVVLNVGVIIHTTYQVWKGTWLITKENQFMLSNFLLDFIENLPFVSRYLQGRDIQAANLVNLYEIVWVAYYLLKCVMLLILSCSRRVRGGERFWGSVADFFWSILPGLASFSAMRMLGHVAPSVFMRHLMEHIGTLQQACSDTGKDGWCPVVKSAFQLLIYIPLSVLYFVIGFDAFLVKLRAVSAASLIASPQSPDAMTLVCQFLQQVLGIIDINLYTQRRLHVFIFGGEDGVLSVGDKALLGTWKAMLAREIWNVFGLRRFLVIMLTWSDYDFQKLVLNTHDHKKHDDAGVELGAVS